jgi:hypothetical protein
MPGPGGTDPPAEELHAPVVVSNADLKRTFLELLSPRWCPERLRRRVRRFEMAAPLFIVYLVIDRDLRAEGVPNRNWAVIDYDDLESIYAAYTRGQLPSQQGVWITSASLKDPANPRLCRPGQTNLQLMAVAPASHAFWDVGEDLVAGPRYQERKRQLRDRLVSAAERAIPGLSDAIAYEEAATPISLDTLVRRAGPRTDRPPPPVRSAARPTHADRRDFPGGGHLQRPRRHRHDVRRSRGGERRARDRPSRRSAAAYRRVAGRPGAGAAACKPPGAVTDQR